MFAGVNNEAADYGYDKATNATGILDSAHINTRYPYWSTYTALPTISFSGHIVANAVGQRVYSLNLTPTDTTTSIDLSTRLPFLRGSPMFY